MATYSAQTSLSDRVRAEELGAALERLKPAPDGVSIEAKSKRANAYEVTGYFPTRLDEVALEILRSAFNCTPFQVSEIPDIDWVAYARKRRPALQIGRFFIYESHDNCPVPSNLEPLQMKSVMAFGTGYHGTTQGCLLALDQLACRRFVAQRVADVGCGTALLAMAAARIWNPSVVAGDIERDAVLVARRNVQANNLESHVTCVESAGFEHMTFSKTAPFNLVIANILKRALILLAPQVARYSSANSYAILSGLLEDQVDDVVVAYSAQGYQLVDSITREEWITLTLQSTDQTVLDVPSTTIRSKITV